MALVSGTGSVAAEQGETTMRANIILQLEFDGDAAYATGGSAAFQQFVRDVAGDQVTISAVAGYSLNAAGTAILNLVHYNRATDKLQAFVASTGVEVANAVDLSGNTFHLTVFAA